MSENVTFWLYVDGFDSWENRDPIVRRRMPLSAGTFDAAVEEGQRLFDEMPTYRTGAYGGHEEYPKNPRIVHHLKERGK